ncbi:phage tail tape measure protein [Flavobacterium sp. HNIBRBA15423]|uniref:phage tail tape measure protein n=1 Tax=Flavobacterium sp. HNIBRBA15423 TaxID=3458683 RepID=UPI004044B256
MARTITDEQIKLSIIINGNSAQKQLLDLEKATRKLTEENKSLHLEKKRLEAAGKKESQEYKNLTATIKSNTAAIDNNKATMKQLQTQIGITGLTMAQLRSKANILKLTLANLIPGSSDYKRYEAELKQVSARISELNGKAKLAKFSLGSIADSFNRYAALGASIIAMGAGMVLSIQKIIDISGKLSDAQADVMKTTKMNKKEVDELTKSFGMLETRTSRIDLLKIAEEGGRIGIVKEEIGSFVEVMNKANVALGDSFTGGVEEVSSSLGKIKFLFQETKDLGVDKAYNSIGSAINELGANGAATERNIADFTLRIGALSDVMKPTIAETFALGAAFEESGIQSEVSARAYSIFLKQASTETGKFAKIMGISQKEVEKMINEDPLEFFLKFSEHLSKNAKNGVEMAKALEILGLGADGVNKIVGAAGNNVGRFRELVDLSNKSFSEGTSLIDEYNIKNTNLAATLEKVQKKIIGWVTPEGFVQWLEDVVNWIAKFIGATEDSDGKVTAWKNTLIFAAKIIAIVTAAMVTNVAWQKLVALWAGENTKANILYIIASKARAVADAIGIVATQAFAAAQMLLSGNIKGATQALRVMNTVLKTSPWGFVLAAIAAIVVAYQAFKENAKEAATQQSIINETMQEADAIIKKETANLNVLLKIAKDETASKEARKKAIEAINKISPEYLGNLTLENIKTAEGKKILDSYILSLRKKHELEILMARQKRIMEEIDKKNQSSLEDEVAWYDKLWATFKNGGNYALATNDLLMTSVERRTKALKKLQDELGLTETQMKKYLEDNPNLIPELISDDKKPPSGLDLTDAKDKKEKKYDDSYLKEEEKMRKELLDLTQKTEEERIALLGDGYAKELSMEVAKHQAKLQNYQEASDDIKKLQEELDKDLIEAQKAGDTKKVASINNMKGLLLKKQTELDSQIEYQEQMHLLKVGTIQEKAGKESIDNLKDEYDQAALVRETNFLNELATLNLTEEERKKRKEQFQQDELKLQEEFLNKQIERYKDILSEINVDGVQFNLLTEEQKDKLAEDLAKIQAALAKIKEAQSGKNDSDKEIDLGITGDTDILGFTQDQWDKFFQNIENGTVGIQTMQMAVGLMKNLWQEFGNYQTASENAQLKKYEKNQDARKKKLKEQLDSGVINQRQYKQGVEEIDKDLDKKKAEIEYKQAKRQRLMAIANVIQSTAQAIIGIWAQFPKVDFGVTAGIMSGVVGALGALQLATILKTPLPAKGLEEGLYPEYVKREQDGKIFKAEGTSKMQTGLFSKPRILVGEGPGDMPEMVIDKRAFAQISPETKNALFNELRGIKGFENGYYDNLSKRYEVPKENNSNQNNSSDSDMLKMALTIISNNTAAMNSLLDNPLIAYISSRDMKSMKELKEGLKRYEDLRNRNNV